MNTEQLDERPTRLLDRAASLVTGEFRYGHRTGAAVLTETDRVATGVFLDTTISSASIHAEAVAVGQVVTSAVADPPDNDPLPPLDPSSDADSSADLLSPADDDAATHSAASSDADPPSIVGVAAVSKQDADSDPVVIPPCGECRELLADYATNAWVVVPGDHGPRTRPLAELLPSDVTSIAEHPRFD